MGHGPQLGKNRVGAAPQQVRQRSRALFRRDARGQGGSLVVDGPEQGTEAPVDDGLPWAELGVDYLDGFTPSASEAGQVVRPDQLQGVTVSQRDVEDHFDRRGQHLIGAIGVTPSTEDALHRTQQAHRLHQPRDVVCLSPYRCRTSRATVPDLPQGADRNRAEVLAERKGLGAGVEDDASDEVVAEPIGQVTQAAEVFGAHGGRCLNLDSDDATAAVLEHNVDLHPVTGAVVELLGPSL